LNIRKRVVVDGRASEPRGAKKSHSMEMAEGIVAITDLLILLSAGCAICWSYVGWDNANFKFYALGIIIPALMVVVVFKKMGLYQIASLSSPMSIFPKIIGILAVIFLVFMAIAFSLKVSEHFSRVWCFSWFLSSSLLVCLGRYLYSFLFWRWARSGRFSKKLVIVGSGDQAKRFLAQLKGRKEPWINLAGIFDDRNKRIGLSFMGLPVLGNLDDLMDYSRKNRVDDIVVTLPWSAGKRILEIVRRLEELPITVSLCSDLAGFMSLRPSFSSMGGVPMLNVVNKPLNGWSYALKGIEDKLLGLFLLIMALPLTLVIALAIKLESDGPVLFRQKRHGFNNKEFFIFKFRTMLHGRQPEEGVPQAKLNDSRVTRVGAFLRRTSLDELPQLLNVMGGTMSLAGPRPHAVEHNEKYCKIINSYFSRHRVKPGITGWAQVNGFRGESQTPEKIQSRYDYDVHYIENWSLMLDIRILMMTVSSVISQENAY